MDYQEILIGGSIAILYPFFFAKLADVYTQYSHLQRMCDEEYEHHKLGSPEYTQCNKIKTDALEKSKTTKFIILMIVGVLALFLSFANIFAGRAPTFGLSLAGFFTLLHAVFMYWDKMNEYMKLGITGIALISLLYLSVRMYQM